MCVAIGGGKLGGVVTVAGGRMDDVSREIVVKKEGDE